MKTLEEKDVIKIMQEVWQEKIFKLSEEVDITYTTKVDGKDVSVLSNARGLKLRHKKSNILYTLEEISPEKAKLTTPEGDTILIDEETLENEYEPG